MARTQPEAIHADRSFVNSNSRAMLTPERRRLLVFALCAIHVLTFVVTAMRPGWGTDATSRLTDAGLYERLAVTLRDSRGAVHVSYPPVAIWMIRLIGGGGLRMTMAWLLVLNALSDAALGVMLMRNWSTRSAILYLSLSAPLLAFLVNGFDTIVVAIMVGGLVAIRRERTALGAVLLSVAVFMKLWPVLVVGVLWAVGYRRAARLSAVCTGAGISLWIAIAGTGAVRDVATYRGSKGWHVESLPGVILALTRGERSRYEQGSYRVGAPAPSLGLLFAGAVGITLLFVWHRVSKTNPSLGGATQFVAGSDQVRSNGLGLVGSASICIMLLGATLLSPQYLAWTFPFLAIAMLCGLLAWKLER